MKTVILKLGGGVLTYKRSRRPVARTNVVKRIAQELAYAYQRRPQLKLIILHGAGSFAHPLVFKHKLKNRRLTNSSLPHVGRVVNNLRELGSLIAKICLQFDLPVIPLQTSSLAEVEEKKLLIKNLPIIETIIKRGGIPLFGGDMVAGKDGRSYVASADDLAVLLARHFKNSEVLFATDVDGVYKHFPQRKGVKPLRHIGRKELLNLIDKGFAPDVAKKYDVTGEMSGKLKKILQLRRKKVVIFNGQKPGLLPKALLAKKVPGTTILL
jgi:isopentenyl phosphate kinase